LLVGALSRGPVSENRDNEIKEGLLWGLKRSSGVDSWVFRVIKNYVQQSEDEFTPNFKNDELSIFEQRIGYYGIHPAQVSVVKAKQGQRFANADVYSKIFEQAVTSVSDPNLNWGVFIKNNGNTGKIAIRNGSIEFGNYVTIYESVDPSGRDISDQISVTGLSINTAPDNIDAIVATYTVPDVVNMVSKITEAGNTLSNFVNTIANRLFDLTASGATQNNRPLFLNIYLLKKTAVTLVGGQDYAQLNPGVNVFAYGDPSIISAVDFTDQVDSTISVQIDADTKVFDLAGRGQDLTSDFVAVLTLNSNSATTVDNFLMTIATTDLF
jgi:hypothetical protein